MSDFYAQSQNKKRQIADLVQEILCFVTFQRIFHTERIKDDINSIIQLT